MSGRARSVLSAVCVAALITNACVNQPATVSGLHSSDPSPEDEHASRVVPTDVPTQETHIPPATLASEGTRTPYGGSPVAVAEPGHTNPAPDGPSGQGGSALPLPAAFDTMMRSADSLPCNEVLELSIRHAGNYPDKTVAASLNATFTSPGEQQRSARGFFYGRDVWRVRFRPDQPGAWTYTYSMMDRTGFQTQGNGAFDCTPNQIEGPLQRDPQNPFRWVFGSGKPYFPVGIQECLGSTDAVKPPLSILIDGEGRNEGKARPVLLDEYFATYGQAGFNLFRFSQRNCSYSILDATGRYREVESALTDDLLSLARAHGFRVMFGIFGTFRPPPLSDERGAMGADDQPDIAGQERFIDYAVARWGVYADFWELLNESEASDTWTTMIANYVRSIDPDRKPITTSWERPGLAMIDINAPHWYESESDLQADLRIQQQATVWKKSGKPVIAGEIGNSGMNWDALSAQRMRIRTWAALFQEVGLVFWETGWAKNGMHNGVHSPGHASNIYLGPEERGYIRALQNFSARLDAGMRMVTVSVSIPGQVRAYGLASDRTVAVYLNHFENHDVPVHDLTISVDLPGEPTSSNSVGEWINPSTGNVIQRLTTQAGRQRLNVPPFAIDLALVVTR